MSLDCGLFSYDLVTSKVYILEEIYSEIGFSIRNLSAKTCLYWLYEVSQSAVQGNREQSYYHVSGIAHCSLSFQLLLLLKYQVSKNTLFSIALIT